MNLSDQKRPWLALAVTLGVQTLTALSQSAPAVLAPVLASELGVGAHQIGNFTGLLYIFAMSSGLLISGYIGRFGAVRFSQISLLFCAAGLLACTVGNIVAIVFGAICIGIGYGLAPPTSVVILGRNVAAGNRGLVFSIKQTGVPLGIAVAGLIVPALLSAYNWRVALVCCIVMCVLFALSLQPAVAIFDRTVDRSETPRASTLLTPLIKIWRDDRKRRLALTSLVYASTQVSFLVFLVTYLTLEHQLSLTLAAFILAVAQLASVAARPFWGWVADLWGAPGKLFGLLGIAMFVACITLAIIPAESASWAYFAVAIVCSVTAVAWNGVFFSELVRISEQDEMATVTGGILFFTFGGAMAGPVIFGLCVSVTGSYGLAFTLLSLLSLWAGVTFSWHQWKSSD